MQMPLLSYPHFSQFLQMHHQQQQIQHYSRIFLPQEPGTPSSGTDSPSPSPSPPLTSEMKTMPFKTSKSFTIDAILGIREGEDTRKMLRGSNTGPCCGEDIRGRIPRLSVAPRDVLTLQLPTDLSLNSAVTTGTGRDLQHPLPGYHNVAPCSRISEKSPTEGKKCGGKSKRVRTIFTPEQLERLEAEFERQQYMVGPERLYLAHTLQLTEAQVKVWFQNRRIKWRKQHLEIQQQRLAAIKQQQQQSTQRSEVEDSDNDSADSSSNYPFEEQLPTAEQTSELARTIYSTDYSQNINSQVNNDDGVS